MPDFYHRSTQKELLDGDDIPFEDIQRNMEELDIINSRLGGHTITRRGVKVFLNNKKKLSPVHIAEIGCGGGDNLRVIKKWAEKHGLLFRLTGIDINPECIAFAQQQPGNKGIKFICEDYQQAVFSQPAELIFSSLFCHHFTDAELIAQLQWMQQHSRYGFFINDLHRHPLAYYSIKLLTRLFSKSYLVKNDAPLSVQRGFKRQELISLLNKANIQAEVHWHWAFRWLVIFRH